MKNLLPLLLALPLFVGGCFNSKDAPDDNSENTEQETVPEKPKVTFPAVVENSTELYEQVKGATPDKVKELFGQPDVEDYYPGTETYRGFYYFLDIKQGTREYGGANVFFDKETGNGKQISYIQPHKVEELKEEFEGIDRSKTGFPTKTRGSDLFEELKPMTAEQVQTRLGEPAHIENFEGSEQPWKLHYIAKSVVGTKEYGAATIVVKEPGGMVNQFTWHTPDKVEDLKASFTKE